MANTEIFMDCPFCIDGIRGENSCESCGGTGFISWGTFEGDFAALVTKCNEIMEKCNAIYDFISS